ncbi:MAG: hypothetical protein ACOYMA_12165 [Bacteroidia bacterium]
MKKLRLKKLIVLVLLSNVIFAQNDDRFYSAPKNKQMKEVVPTTKKDTAKNKPVTEISFAIGLTQTNDGTVRYKFDIPWDTSFLTNSKSPGFYLHFGVQIPIKNNFYIVIRQQLQSETSRSLVFEKETDFLTMSFLTNIGIEKRFKGFYIGTDLAAGLAIVQNNQIDVVMESNNNFSKSLFGINANLGYQFNNGIRLGYSYRFSGETKYEYAYTYTPMLGNFEFNSSSSSYSSSLSTFFIGYSIKVKDKKKTTQPIIYESNRNIPLTPTVINYSSYSLEELNKMLANATKDEKYNEANNIQIEIDKRKASSKYTNLNDEELKQKLESTLKIENYVEAEIIQKEIDKRALLKKDNNKNSSDKQPAKKTLKELEDDLKKAMDTEDYKKADEIQKEINKLKK